MNQVIETKTIPFVIKAGTVQEQEEVSKKPVRQVKPTETQKLAQKSERIYILL